ncbi:acyl-CoA oxidase [Pisolithus microcarpus]|nr:acyl-CoA oxidase [Pisolithus microcarpus]
MLRSGSVRSVSPRKIRHVASLRARCASETQTTRLGVRLPITTGNSRAFSVSAPSMEGSALNSLDTFTEEEEMLRESVRRFATDVVGPKVREMDEKERMDPDIIKGLFEQGLMGIETSVEHGGAESSFTSAIIAIEELAKVDPSVSVMCDVHNTLVNTILRKYGTKEQQDRWLPQLSESKLGSFCLSEPASGSDAFSLQTRAVKDGNHWVINGSKMWITNSNEAEIFLIFANIDPSKGYKGITCFIATKDMGIQIAKKEEKLGIRASSTCTLNFDDLRIPDENIIGGEGKGYKIAIEILNEGRIGIAAQMLGLAQGAFDKAVPYTYTRQQFGQPVGTFQGMAFQIAQAAVEIGSARLLTYNAARRKEEGKSFTKEAAMAKYWASVIAQRVSGQAIEWAGGVGFTRETGIEKYWRDSKIGAIYEGTSNIQLQTIAKFIQKEYS